ncbi:MAG: hypothetical protein JO171_06785 [Paludibacterium sp.]|uniref:hypothetical protein n=1 Tax=Paludibacterium sp. TaxID=1917523 RepID=UPI0025F3F4FF|nr:hypothetical protein [Paludibacterium sp.]MBV8046838.1 hypothetical protein [Paludibacterium sp.]MBV8646875.1 hypothetical protein [Paludibacterium sp.]
MCAGIEFEGQFFYFKDTVQLPVLRRDGSMAWLPWGVPFGVNVPGLWSGACARRESLLDGKWRRLDPVPVKIPCAAFMEREARKQAVWFPVDARLAIQGALVRLSPQQRALLPGQPEAVVYVVTEPAAGDVASIHDRMPRLIPLGD